MGDRSRRDVLYYMRSRYYDPLVGRFISEDPSGIAGGLNLYAYAANDPVTRRDPTGTSPECGDEGFDSSGKDRFGERPATNGTGLPDLVATAPCPQPFDAIGTPWDLDPPGRANAIDFRANNASIGMADPPATRTVGQCFKENTAPVVGPSGFVAAALGTFGGVLYGSGRLGTMAANQLALQGATELDLFFSTPKAGSSLVERGINLMSQSRAQAARARAFTLGGQYVLVGSLGFFGAYLGTSAVICAVNPGY